MSTYVHLACLDHDPPLLADAESDQHRHKDGVMERIRSWVEQRDVFIELYLEGNLDPEYFLANSVRFLASHRGCRIAAKDENDIWLDLGQGIPGPAQQRDASWEFDVEFGVDCSLAGDHDQHIGVIDGNGGVTARITWRTA